MAIELDTVVAAIARVLLTFAGGTFSNGNS